jgi:REP element-mobilizing transposase RayT
MGTPPGAPTSSSAIKINADEDVGAPIHKFWHSRGYLPHCDTPGLLQFITFRLNDSLPAQVLYRLMRETGDEVQKLKRIEVLLDAGHGECLLRQHAVANIIEDALPHDDGQRYSLLAWCVMPNHVHVLVETRADNPLPTLVQSWKSYTARLINRHLGRTGTVWMRDYFDRYIRDDYHLAAVIAYIHSNPVKAGLVSNEHEWLHSSAGAPTSSSAIKINADEDVGAPTSYD